MIPHRHSAATGMRALRPLGLVLFALLVFWACDGGNLFGPGVGVGPRIVDLSVPASVDSGEELVVRARAVGAVRVDSVSLGAVVGDFEGREVVAPDRDALEISVEAVFSIPSVITDTLVTVTARATDAQRNTSEASQGVIRAVDLTPPAVSVTLSQDEVGLGREMDIEVGAQDNIGLRVLGFRFVDEDGETVVELQEEVEGRTAVHTFTYTVPEDLDLGDFVVEGVAEDLEGNHAAAPADQLLRVVFIDEEPPVVEILAPSPGLNIPALQPLTVRARVTDNDAVSHVTMEGVALRGDPDLGTDHVVQKFEPWPIELDDPSPDTTLVRILRSSEDFSAEEVHVVVTAEDRQGNVGSDTIQITMEELEPPKIQFQEPPQGMEIASDDSVFVRARIQAQAGIQHVTYDGVAHRGERDVGTHEEVQRFAPRSEGLGGEVTDTIFMRWLQPTGEDEDETVWIRAVVEDGLGNVGRDSIHIGTTPEAPPALSVSVDVEEPGTVIPLGESIIARAMASASAGIQSVTFDGVEHRGDRELGTHQEVALFESRTAEVGGAVADSVVRRLLQPTGEEPVGGSQWVRAVLEDVDGNVVRDSIAITMGGPRIRILAPEEGRTFREGQTVDVEGEASDPAGLTVVEVFVGGVVVDTLRWTNPSAPEEMTFPGDWQVELPEGAEGQLTLQARATNSDDVVSETSTRTVLVSGEEDDTIAPSLRIIPTPRGATGDPNRVELGDTVDIRVEGEDDPGGTGVRIRGFTVQAVPQTRGAGTPDPTVISMADTIAPEGSGASGVQDTTFTFVVEDLYDTFAVDPEVTPDTLILDFVGYMVDGADNCGAAISSTSHQSLECDDSDPDAVVAADNVTLTRALHVVPWSTTARLPEGGAIADALVHPGKGWLILSNLGLNRLEVYDLNPFERLGTVSVGSQPWGLSLATGDDNTLWVANSGGTNISEVDLSSGIGSETHRISTPNALLWDVQEETGQGVGVSFDIEFHDFSDRPQFLAQDSEGLFVFSTLPTGAAPDGTVRLGRFDPAVGPDMAIRLVTDHGTVESGTDQYAVAGVDYLSTTTVTDGSGFQVPGIVAETHRPGDRDDVFESDPFYGWGATPDAVLDLRDDKLPAGVPSLFQPRVQPGNWDVESVGLSDTTFIAHSTDRSAVVVGEGVVEVGRIFYWRAQEERFTRETTVTDLTGNAAERVLGVAMNRDGALGVGRGLFATYFFDPDLRLEGTVPTEPGGAGVALHPLHTGGPLGPPEAVSLAFVPVGDGEVEIHSTRNFDLQGRAFIRDTMLGPVRATLPFPGDNAGKTCDTVTVAGEEAVDPFSAGTDPDCIVVKLSGATEGGGVAVVEITAHDVTRGPN